MLHRVTHFTGYLLANDEPRQLLCGGSCMHIKAIPHCVAKLLCMYNKHMYMYLLCSCKSA